MSINPTSTELPDADKSSDITERKRMEKALQDTLSDAEQHAGELDALIASIADAIMVVDRDGSIRYMNPEALRIFGYSPDDYRKPMGVRTTQLQACSPDGTPLNYEDMLAYRALRGEIVKNVEMMFKHADTGPIWIIASAAPIRSGNEISGAVITLIDNTKRKQAEEKLKNSEEFNRSMLDSLPMNIAVLDGSGNIVFVNRAWLEFGRENHACPVESIDVGANYLEVCRKSQGGSPDDTPTALNGMLSVFNGEQDSFEMEYPCNSPDKKQWFTMRVSRVMAGTFRGIIVVHTDITLRKTFEEALADEKARAELYLDLMGHDINNMNHVALGYLELLQASLKSKGMMEKDELGLLAKSYDKLQDSSRLIENVRKLQKASSGDYIPREVDACQAVTRVLARYSNMPGLHLSFDLDLPPSCPVNADDLLYEVFENLVGNAIKHGGPEIAIRIHFDTIDLKDGKYNVFAVEDNGPGIPDNLKDKVFNRLQQGPTKARGLGLGLFLVKSLVNSYHGKVWVEDRVPGDHTKGARFVVMLPAVKK
jgi:PAS domain S-box-containing protein